MNLFRLLALALLFPLAGHAAAPTTTDPESTPGAVTYKARCAMCHEGQVPKAPNKTFVGLMPPDAIYEALTVGIMQTQSAGLTAQQKQEVAEYLTGAKLDEHRVRPSPPKCTGEAAKWDAAKPTLTGWGYNARNEHFVTAEVARLAAADVPRLKLKWALAYPNAFRARSRPTFAEGAVYVGSQDGTVYALDARTGCARWTFRTTAEVRTPVFVGAPAAGAAPLAVFGDLVGRVYALNARTGELVWKVKADDHPAATITGAPLMHEGRVYVPVSSLEEASTDPAYECCTFRGSLLALDAATGNTVWKTYTIDEAPKLVGKTKAGTNIYAPSGAPIWNSPTLDLKRGLIYVGTGNAYSAPAAKTTDAIVAFDLKTGARKWVHQVFEDDAWNVGCMINNANCPEPEGPDLDIGAGTTLMTMGDRQFVAVGLKDGTAMVVDADKPEHTVWKRKLGRGSIQGGIQFGMAFDGQRLYVPIADMEDSKDGKVHTEPAQPGLNALDPLTGAILWRSPAPNLCNGVPACDPGILASISVIPGVAFAGHMDGRLRGYDTATGKVLWETDTSPEITGVNGVKGKGGSFGGGGPVVYDGMVFANSGYGLYFHLPGNLLLVYSVDGK